MNTNTLKPTLILFLTWCACVVRTRGGYVSRKRANGGMATADYAITAVRLAGYEHTSVRLEDGRAAALSDDDVEVADSVYKTLRAHFSAHGTRSDYEERIATLLGERRIERRDAGYVASMIPLAERINERKAQDKARAELAKDAAHVGRVGERIKLAATLERAQWRDSQWGGYWLLAFRDGAGNELVWFSGSQGAERAAKLGEGAQVNLTATVKEHQEFRGVPNTKLTRASVKPA